MSAGGVALAAVRGQLAYTLHTWRQHGICRCAWAWAVQPAVLILHALPGAPVPTRCRVEGAVRLLQERLPSSQILLLGLLPCGMWGLPGQANYKWPSPYARALPIVNTRLRCGGGGGMRNCLAVAAAAALGACQRDVRSSRLVYSCNQALRCQAQLRTEVPHRLCTAHPATHLQGVCRHPDARALPRLRLAPAQRKPHGH